MSPSRENDSDVLNAQIVLASLCMLKEKMVHQTSSPEGEGRGLYRLREMDLCSASVLECIQHTRPPCRWEEIPVTMTALPPPSTTTTTQRDSYSSGTSLPSSRLASAVGAPQWRMADTDTPLPHEAAIPLRVVLDIAHNPPAIASLMRKVADRYRGMNVRWCGVRWVL